MVQVGRGGVEKSKGPRKLSWVECSLWQLEAGLGHFQERWECLAAFLVPKRVDRGRGYWEEVGG